jgi:hypothetical protein
MHGSRIDRAVAIDTNIHAHGLLQIKLVLNVGGVAVFSRHTKI